MPQDSNAYQSLYCQVNLVCIAQPIQVCLLHAQIMLIASQRQSPACLRCHFAVAGTIVYGFLMVAAGGKFVGPLGLSLMWCIYHALAPWLLLFYSILPFEFEVTHRKALYRTGRVLFNILCNVGFVMSFGVFIAAVVLACLGIHPPEVLGAHFSIPMRPVSPQDL